MSEHTTDNYEFVYYDDYDVDWGSGISQNFVDLDTLIYNHIENVDNLVHPRTAVVSLSNSEIKNLRATPQELVAAPGAGKWLEIESLVLILNAGSEALTESSDNLRVFYDSTSGAQATAAIVASGFIDNAADIVCLHRPSGFYWNLSDLVNKNLVLANVGDGEYGGNASNDATMTVIVRYWIHDDTI